MEHFICPVCGAGLTQKERSLVCPKGHSFDLSKEGYVNLLIAKKGKQGNHGDDKLMVRSRRDFLNKGYYRPLLEQVCRLAVLHAQPEAVVLDAGCGECWYTAQVWEALEQAGKKAVLLGVDISKDALAAGAKRNHSLELAVGSVFHLPVAEQSCQLLLSLFAPYCKEEFLRVLKPQGKMILVVPLENHLWGLKQAVYEKPYKNEVKDWALEGFSLVEKTEIRQRIHLPCQEDIWNLFTMTPYYYKTGEKDQQRLAGLSQLDTEIEFAAAVYQKN